MVLIDLLLHKGTTFVSLEVLERPRPVKISTFFHVILRVPPAIFRWVL